MRKRAGLGDFRRLFQFLAQCWAHVIANSKLDISLLREGPIEVDLKLTVFFWGGSSNFLSFNRFLAN